MDFKKIDGYLFREMDEAERENFENEFFANDDLFAEVTDRENELVDGYVRGNLSGDELARFEKSLETLPARRQKIANANTLREFIADERPVNKTITIAERSGFFSRYFSFSSPAFQFASIGAILLLAFATAALLIENRRLSSLEAKLASSRQRADELAIQIENAQDTTGALTEDLFAERKRVSELESKVAQMQSTSVNSQTAQPDIVRPTIATILLAPANFRGAGLRPMERIAVPSGIDRISAVVIVPDTTATGAKVSVRLNGETIANGVPVRTRPGGQKRITITIPVGRIGEARNELVVYDTSGNKLGDNYTFSIDIQK
ncbi:MAG TPA: hypothetical protein VNA22_08460 [Pyrinomonadaceae bacterium]|nr:hypothetical protein [Pyrinomonadaceae bacterium]